MFYLSDVVVGFWFIPVTVFIIIPLLMFCGSATLKLLKRLKVIPERPKQKAKFNRTTTQAERNRYGLPDKLTN